MKKILLALLTLMSVISYSQTTGYFRYDSVRIMKAGANSNLIIENATRDSLGFLYNYGNGRTRFEVIRAVAGGIKVGEDTIIIGGGQCDFLIGGSVTPEGGFRFSVQEADYGIECLPYNSDSATVFVDSSDATFDRFDVIYLDSDEVVKVLTGIPAENPAIPQLPSGTILLTVVSVEAGAIGANVTSINVYFENDATITPSGTTAVGNSTVAPYAGTYHIRITTNNNGDFVDIIKTSGTWDISGQDFLSFHIKNRAVIPQLANWRASLWNGASTGSQVSGEVILNYNKNNSTTYQAISIPMSAFGNITNTNIDRIRLRYTSNNATTHTGIDLDNIFFGDNLQQPGTGNFNATLNMPPAFTVSPTNTIQNNGTWNVTANGSTAQYIRGDGSLATFSAVTTVGAFGSQASQVNGLFISGSNIYGQPVTATEPGMTTPAMKASWDSVYTVEELSSLGYPIMTQIDAARTGFKRIVFDNVYKNTDTTIHLDTTGGGGVGGFFTPDQTSTGATTHNTDAYPFALEGGGGIVLKSRNVGTDSVWLTIDNQHAIITATDGVTPSTVDIGMISQVFNHWQGNYQFTNLPDSITGTNYMMVWDDATDQIHKAPLPTAGGGSSLFPTTGTGTATGAVIGDLAGNVFTITQGGNEFLHIDPTVNAEHTHIKALNTTNDDNYSQFQAEATDISTKAELYANFNGGVKEAFLTAEANATVATIGYTADTHTFTGGVRLNALAGNGVGVVSVDNDGDLSWSAGGGSGATTALDNLAAVAINTSLISDADNTDDLGSTANAWKDIYARRLLLDGSTSGTPTIFSDALGNALNGTTLSGTGVVPTVMYAAISSDFTMSDVNTVQPVFNTSTDVWTLQGSTTYFFEGSYTLTHGATSHSTGMSFELSGGASITSINYQTVSWATAIGTNTASQTTNNINVATNSAINAAGAIAVESIVFSGVIRMNAGGTVTPSITWSAAPGGSPLARVGTWIRFTPIGTNTAQSIGNVN